MHDLTARDIVAAAVASGDFEPDDFVLLDREIEPTTQLRYETRARSRRVRPVNQTD